MGIEVSVESIMVKIVSEDMLGVSARERTVLATGS